MTNQELMVMAQSHAKSPKARKLAAKARDLTGLSAHGGARDSALYSLRESGVEVSKEEWPTYLRVQP